LYNRTGSAFLCILYHVVHNNAATYMLMLFPNAGQIIPTLGTIMSWVVAIVLMVFFWVKSPHENAKGEMK
jgi:hypothetical protein